MGACNSVLASLKNQLSSSFSVQETGGGCLIETPFLYPDRRQLTIYIETTALGEIELSDDGYAHAYARVSGVGRTTLTNAIAEAQERYGVTAENDEVVIRTTEVNLLTALLMLTEASQGIAETVSNRTLRDSYSRLDRQLERALVISNRTYERRGRVPIGPRDINVDYNVLASDEYQQLSLFSIGAQISNQAAESMAWRIERLKQAPRNPEFSGEMAVITDDAVAFRDSQKWHRIMDTVRDTQVTMIPISDHRRITTLLRRAS